MNGIVFMQLVKFAFLFLPFSLLADGKNFDFKDPKGVNSIIFQLDALLESINGSAAGISGSVYFNPKNPTATRGSIVLESASLRVDNPVLQEHMHGEDWLHVSKFPKIEFVIDKLTDVTRDELSIEALAMGKMTIGKVTIKMSIPIKVIYLAEMLEKRNKVAGDLLIVKSEFFVKRDDFGIRAGEYLDKVANDIKISINLAGACPLN